MRILLPLFVLAAAVGGYAMATAPRQTEARAPLYAFDPVEVGQLEQRAWAQYYWRQWLPMFDSLLRMVRSSFGLPFHQALYATFENTLAQVAWARQGAEGGEAQRRMETFFEFVRAPTGGQYDSKRAAELEVNWWAVHRNRAQYPDRTALSRALAETYAEVYQLPMERMLPAAALRAEAMDISDQWNRDGKLPESPLLPQIRDLLVTSYAELKRAIAE